MPKHSSSIATIVGIDPGSHNLGAAVLTVDIEQRALVSCQAWTFSGSKLAGKGSWDSYLHGERGGRILAHEDNLLQLFQEFQPFSIVSEAPFINNKFPQAGLALTQVVSGILHAVRQYDPWMQLCMVEPSLAKNAVGAPGNAPKEVVKEKILLCTPITSTYVGTVSLNLLDEHSIDALAIGYHRFITLLG